MSDTLLSVGVLDDAGAVKRANVFLPSTMTLAQIQGWSDVYVPLLDAVDDGKILDSQVTFGLTLPGGLKGSPVADSTVRRGADFTFIATGSRYKWGTYAPAWSLTYITSGDIDTAPTPVSDFLSAYSLGLVVSSVTYRPTNGQGFTLGALSKSKETFRK